MKLLIICVISLLLSNEAFTKETSEQTAIKFLQLVSQEDYSSASKMSSPQMLIFLSEDKIKEFWTSLKSRYGKVVSIGELAKQKATENEIFLVKIYFPNDSLNTRVVIDSSMQIAGLLFVPFPKTYNFASPSYVDSTKFSEKQVRFGDESWELPGLLSLPIQGDNLPALVLVHGSGPNDKDGTVGGSKIFRDIALGLASQEIAVLRYEKRTKWHAHKIMKDYKNLTVKEETIDDAIFAAEFLKTLEKIDPTKIFILGHSMGGYLLPRIAERADWLAGIIISNGNARKLYELVPDQYEYIMSLDGELTSSELEEIEKVRLQVRLIEEGKINENTLRDSLVLGLPANYLLDLRDFRPLELVRNIQYPILVLQADKDYQVTNLEFDLWREALSDNKKATFYKFDNLNHLFVFTEGISKPQDYDNQGFVDENVIKYIANWIKKTVK